jgi:hypothetical protein
MRAALRLQVLVQELVLEVLVVQVVLLVVQRDLRVLCPPRQRAVYLCLVPHRHLSRQLRGLRPVLHLQ